MTSLSVQLYYGEFALLRQCFAHVFYGDFSQVRYTRIVKYICIRITGVVSCE